MLFLGGIGKRLKRGQKAAKLRKQRDSYEKEKMRIDQSERNVTFKREKNALRKLMKDKFLIQYELSKVLLQRYSFFSINC